MREFTDASGRAWTATIRGEAGSDYKGRFHLVLGPHDATDDELELPEIRWNSERTARRTLETMSEVELRRRLRTALARHGLRLAS